MKRQALEEVVNRYIEQIEKHSDRVPGNFDQSAIHDLRVGYKKIRAFLRLLQLEPDAGDLQMPLKLKAVYQSSGKVRDLQLFLEQIGNAADAALLPAYCKCCNQQLFACKEQAVKSIEDIQFKKVIHSIKKELPGHLQPDILRKFMQQKIAAIHILLLVVNDDKDLHTIRKHLKDIIYVIRIYEHDFEMPFPIQDYASEKQLSDMASRLGDFNDCCIAVSLLQTLCVNESSMINEKLLLQKLQQNWVHQKEEQKKKLLQEVQVLAL
jgi:CHAD domain-containing protein